VGGAEEEGWDVKGKFMTPIDFARSATDSHQPILHQSAYRFLDLQVAGSNPDSISVYLL